MLSLEMSTSPVRRLSRATTTFIPDHRDVEHEVLERAHKRQTQFENQMGAIDKQELQLRDDLWKIVRNQIKALVGEIASLWDELNKLKQNDSPKGAVEELRTELDATRQELAQLRRTSVSASDLGTLDNKLRLEIASQADAHLRTVTSVESAIQNRTEMETRLDYLEKFIGESADRQAKATRSLDDAHKKLQDVFGDLAGEKSKRELVRSTMEERLQYLEKRIGDHADKHFRALEELEANTKMLRGGLDEVSGNLQGLEGNMTGELKKSASIQDRLDYLEKFMGESADKSTRELEAAQAKLQDLSGHLEGEKAANASVSERLEFIEQQIGNSADNQHKLMEALEAKQRRLTGVLDDLSGSMGEREVLGATLQERVNYLEKFIGESADKHGNAIEAAQAKLADAQGRIKSATEHFTTVEQRLEYLERLVGDSASKNSKTMEDAQTKLRDFQGQVAAEKAAREQTHANIQQRLEFMEKQIGDSAKNHSKALEALEANNKKLAGSLDALHGNVKGQAKALDTDKATLGERLEYLEKFVGDSADRHQKHTKELEAASSKMRDLMGQITNEKTCRIETHASVEKRLEHLEREVGGSVDHHAKGLQAIDSHNKKINSRLDDMHQRVKSEADARQKHHDSIDERLTSLEQHLGDSSDKHLKHSKDLDAANLKMKDLTSRLQMEKTARDEHRATIEERLEQIERCLGDTADTHNALHSSLQELRGRIGSPESLARAEHIQCIHKVLASEKAAREMQEQSIQLQLSEEKKMRDSMEATVENHLKREKEERETHQTQVRDQVDREQKLRNGQFDKLKELIAYEKTAREQTHQTLHEFVFSEKAIWESRHSTYEEHLEREKTERGLHRGSLDDLLAKERTDQAKHTETVLYPRFDALEKAMGIFDEASRKDREDRGRELKRIWDAIDNHTHDLSTTVSKTPFTFEVEDDLSEQDNKSGYEAFSRVTSASSPMASVAVPPVYRYTSANAQPAKSMPTVPLLTVTSTQPSVTSMPVARISRSSPGPVPATSRAFGSSSLSVTPGNAAARVQSMHSMQSVHSAAGRVQSMHSMQSVHSAHSVQSLRTRSPLTPEKSRRHVEKITCGQTRYDGETRSSAKVEPDA